MQEMARLVRPDVTVVTTIGREHITALKSLEVTRREKSFLVEILAEDGLAILNYDDPNVLWMADRTRARIKTYGSDSRADVRATEVAVGWPTGTHFTVRAENDSAEVESRLNGRHWATVVLAAVAVGLELGLTLERAAELIGVSSRAPTDSKRFDSTAVHG